MTGFQSRRVRVLTWLQSLSVAQPNQTGVVHLGLCKVGIKKREITTVEQQHVLPLLSDVILYRYCTVKYMYFTVRYINIIHVGVQVRQGVMYVACPAVVMDVACPAVVM